MAFEEHFHVWPNFEKSELGSKPLHLLRDTGRGVVVDVES